MNKSGIANIPNALAGLAQAGWAERSWPFLGIATKISPIELASVIFLYNLSQVTEIVTHYIILHHFLIISPLFKVIKSIMINKKCYPPGYERKQFESYWAH